MQTRYMERSNSMTREKRGLDSSSGDEGPDRKRPFHSRSTSLSRFGNFSWILGVAISWCCCGGGIFFRDEIGVQYHFEDRQ